MSKEKCEDICTSSRKAVPRLKILEENNSAAATGEKVLQKCYDKVLQMKRTGLSPDEQAQASLDYQYSSVDTVLSENTAIEGEPGLNAPLESFFDFEMLDDFMNNSAFTANCLDQHSGFEYPDVMMTGVASQIDDQADSWTGNPQ